MNVGQANCKLSWSLDVNSVIIFHTGHDVSFQIINHSLLSSCFSRLAETRLC
jgi:hypothetical protein